MGKQAINLRFDEGLLALVDASAGSGLRTAWIEDACRQRIQREQAAGPEDWSKLGTVDWSAGVKAMVNLLDE